MRILVVTTSFPRHADDWAGRFVLDQAKALTLRGHTVHVVAPDDPGAARADALEGVEVTRVRYFAPRRAQVLAYGAGMPENVRRRPYVLAQLPLLARALRRGVAAASADGRADVILAHWALAGLAASRPAARRRLGLATTLNGSDLRMALDPSYWQRVVRRALSGATRTLVLGSEMAQQVVNAGLAQARRVEIVPYGVEDELVDRAVGPGEGGRVLFVGRLLASKGLPELAEAVGRLAAGRPTSAMPQEARPAPVRLVCVGDGPLRAELDGLPHVECLGPLDRASLLDEMSRASVVALPSHGEGLPIALLEAMALGRAVLATPVGAVPELLRVGQDGALATGSGPIRLDERQCGVLVRVGDTDSLTEALASLLGDGATRATLGGRARARIADSYTWGCAAARLENVLEACRREAAGT